MWQVGSDVTSDTEAQRLVSSKGGVSKRSLCVHVCVLNYAGPYRAVQLLELLNSCFLAKQLSGKIGHIHGASSHYHYRQVICRTPEAKSKLQRPLIKLIKTQKQTIEH